MAPLSIFVIVPFGLLYRWWADGPQFELMNSLHWIVALAMALSLPALFMTLVAGVPLYVVALRRNIVSIWLAATIGFVCPWIYYLGRYALIEAQSPLYHSIMSIKYWLDLTETLFDAKFLVIPASAFGMFVGIVFWFVAPRPAREATGG
ncbi:MAG TPA: hypothetical protein VFW28_05295 [Micropepsaceae bacterium]|nr:hypothetical protein [Micropepsaceae bacterium]